MGKIAATGLGFLAAAIIPAAVLSVVAPLSGKLSVSSALGSFLGFFPFSAAAVIVFGMPAYLLLRRFGPGNWWSVLAVGFLLGVPVAIALRLPGRPDFRDFLTTGPLAAASTLVFWLIWRRGRNSSEDEKRSEK